MYYEINVSLNGTHFFATHERSAQHEEKMREIVSVMLQKFPKSEGYMITVTRWEKTGRTVDIY